MNRKIAIILPAFNEEQTLPQTIREFHAALPGALIVVIDNRSSDNTAGVAKGTFIETGCNGLLLSEPRPGKGNAIRKAFREVDADIYVMCDADSTYSPGNLHLLLEPVATGRAEIVVGDRLANSMYKSQNERPFHNFGNNLVRGLINFLFRSNLRDIMSGYRVMSYRFVKNFPVLSEGFELETEMTLHAVDKRFPLMEIPVAYGKRPQGSSSKLNTFRDGFRVLKTILWIFKDYRPLVFFFSLSLLCFLLGIGIGIPVILDFMRTGLVPKFPSAILASGLVVLSAMFLIAGLILDTVAKFQRAQFEMRVVQEFPTAFRHRGDA